MIEVKFFAMLRQVVEGGEAQIDASDVRTVGDLLDKMEGDRPGLRLSVEKAKARVAVNHEFVAFDAPVQDGDEVAFIPPMSGGSGASADELVRIQLEDFSVDEEIARVMRTSAAIGGVDIFLGTARELSRGRNIEKIEFEHYPGMAEKQLRYLRTEAIKRFNIIEVGIVHRYGTITIGENIVLIIAAAQHRKEAFEACRWCIDELKQITPIWKKEVTVEGDFWVEEHP